MSISETRIDDRPFRSKADKAREVALQNQYRRLAIPAVVAALQMGRCTAIDRGAGPMFRNQEAKVGVVASLET